MRIQTLVLLSAGAVCAIVTGAGTAGVVTRTNARTVVHTAALESECPVDQIRLLDGHEGLGVGWYELEICGSATRYMRTQTTFHRPGQHPDSLSTPAASVPCPAADPQPHAQPPLLPRS